MPKKSKAHTHWSADRSSGTAGPTVPGAWSASPFSLTPNRAWEGQGRDRFLSSGAHSRGSNGQRSWLPSRLCLPRCSGRPSVLRSEGPWWAPLTGTLGKAFLRGKPPVNTLDSPDSRRGEERTQHCPTGPGHQPGRCLQVSVLIRDLSTTKACPRLLLLTPLLGPHAPNLHTGLRTARWTPAKQSGPSAPDDSCGRHPALRSSLLVRHLYLAPLEG